MKHKLRPNSMAMHEASTRWPKSACKPALSVLLFRPLKGKIESRNHALKLSVKSTEPLSQI